MDYLEEKYKRNSDSERIGGTSKEGKRNVGRATRRSVI